MLSGSVTPLFRAFSRRYPAVTFDVFVTDRRVDLVADGIDIALRIGERGTAGYVGRTLARYRHRLVASPKFLATHRLTAPLDLTRIPCACWRSPGGSVWQLGDTEVDLEPLFVTNDYLHLLRLAEAGDVVTEVPPFLATRGLEQGKLVEPLPEHPLPERPMRALVVERRSMSLEEYFQVTGFEDSIERADWGGFESRLLVGLDRILEILDRNALKATFFFLGWIAERHPAVLGRVAGLGHEIGVHGGEPRGLEVHRVLFCLIDEAGRPASDVLEVVGEGHDGGLCVFIAGGSGIGGGRRRPPGGRKGRGQKV